MRLILTGIYAAYDANVALETALPGGLHFEMAPQGTAYTYAVYSLITARPEYVFDDYDEVVRIQFDIYAATNALRLAAYEKLIAVYDDARIAATGYSPLIMERINQQMVRDGDQDEIFRSVVDYEGRWRKS